MEYEDIPKYVKRYSFSSKMEACQKHSISTMTLFGSLPPDKMIKMIFPWELETFLLFAVAGNEYQESNILENNERKFAEIIQAIRNSNKTEQLQKSDGESFALKLLMSFGLIQFDVQETQLYKYYRYNFFFNYIDEKQDINMHKAFRSKFGVDYREILQLGSALNIFLSSQKADEKMIRFIIQYYYSATTPLIITRNEYQELLKRYSKSIDDYEFCLRPSYSYPFILDKGESIYIPLPHLLYRATTSALFYRLTENNAHNRERLGVVIENYLFTILNSAQAYNEVLQEDTYVYMHTDRKTPDIQIRSGDSFLFIESKSSVPPMGIRIFDRDIMAKHIDSLAQAMNQLYKQIKLFLEDQYYFFSEAEHPQISKKKVWGLVSVLEDSFVSRKAVYDEFANKAGIVIDSPEYKWAINHVKLVGLYDIEKCSFNGINIVRELNAFAKQNKPYDFPLIYPSSKHIVNSEYRAFVKQLGEDIGTMTEQMQKEGIIS